MIPAITTLSIRSVKRLAGKAALVTGASRGVGARTAVLLGRAKVHVGINYRDKLKRAEEVSAEVRRFSVRAFPLKAISPTPKKPGRCSFRLTRSSGSSTCSC